MLEELNLTNLNNDKQNISDKTVDLMNNNMSSKDQNDYFPKIDFSEIDKKLNSKVLLKEHSKKDRFKGVIVFLLCTFFSFAFYAGRASGLEAFIYIVIILAGFLYSWFKIFSDGSSSNAEELYKSMYEGKVKTTTYLPNDLEYTILGNMRETADKKWQALDFIKREAYYLEADAIINLNWSVVKTPIVTSGRKGHVSTKIEEEYTYTGIAIKVEENFNQNRAPTKTDLDVSEIDNDYIKK